MRFGRPAGVADSALVVSFLLIAALSVPIGSSLRPTESASPSRSQIVAAQPTIPTAAPPTPRASRAATATPPSPTRDRETPTPSVETPTLVPATPTPVPETGTDAGQLAPDFELRTPEGDTVRLSDFRGRPVWINFWAPWCLACRTEMPRLEGFYLEHQRDGLVILGVGIQDSPESMRAYADEVGVSYPIVVDPDGWSQPDIRRSRFRSTTGSIEPASFAIGPSASYRLTCSRSRSSRSWDRARLLRPDRDRCRTARWH